MPLAVPDLVGPDLRLLFCGINPGTLSGQLGLHFARSGNRFWKLLHAAGACRRCFASLRAAHSPLVGHRHHRIWSKGRRRGPVTSMTRNSVTALVVWKPR